MRVAYYPYTLTELKSLRTSHEDKLIPMVHFGIIMDSNPYNPENGCWCVEKYEARNFTSINGIPFDEFKSETEWRKLPKGWTYNTQLFDVGLTLSWELYKKDCEGLSFTNPEGILSLIDKGWWVPKKSGHEVVEAEIKDKQYRIIKKYPCWESTYGQDKSTYTWLKEGSFFFTYDEALQSCVMKIQDHYEALRQETLIDNEMSIQWVLGKVPDHYKDRVEVLLRSLPTSNRIRLRYYQNQVLWESSNGNWMLIYDCKD